MSKKIVIKLGAGNSTAYQFGHESVSQSVAENIVRERYGFNAKLSHRPPYVAPQNRRKQEVAEVATA